MKHLITTIALALLSLSSYAKITIQSVQGWFESGCVTWTPEEGMTYSVFIRPENGTYTQLDKELIRNYGAYLRADMPGLKAGRYQFKVVAANGDEAVSDVFTAAAHDRSGFAHVGMNDGIGAYRNDGTLKTDAKVLYVDANNAKTVATNVITSSKGATTQGKGLQDIIYLYQKGYDTTPLCIRIIGTIKAADMDRFDSSEEGLQVKGRNAYSDMPITIEGIGEDAAIWGFGILLRNCKGTELRNFAVMLCMDDCISLDTENSNVWVHNMDLFYGNTGGDADQAKGDGTIDVKGRSKNITISYNHFFDSGKCSLGGMKDETTDCWNTYHHNWFDHSDSRHPRVRTMFFHVYNNYYDGNAKYGVGMTSGGSALVEQNCFRNCKYPMLISRQGTDAEGDGTFSGETGGVIKAYDNAITGARKLQYYDGSQTNGKWDAVLVDKRDAEVTATAYSGGTSYNYEADMAARTTYIENHIDSKDEVPAICMGTAKGREGLGAGRMNGGDFHWTFNNTTEDTNDKVITALKKALQEYKSKVIPTGESGNTGDSGESGNTGDSGQPDQPDQPGTSTPLTSPTTCYFTNSTKSPSSSMVTVNGNYSNSKGTVTYQDKSYSDCVKMESSTEITIKPTGDCTITLIFGGSTSASGKSIYLDGRKLALDSEGTYSFDAKGNTSYSLKKGDSINLFLIVFKPKETANAIESIRQSSSRLHTYSLQGTKAISPASGIYIENGKKVLKKK